MRFGEIQSCIKRLKLFRKIFPRLNKFFRDFTTHHINLFDPDEMSQPVLDGHADGVILLQDQGHVESAHLEQREKQQQSL